MRGVDGPLGWREFADCAQVDPEIWFPESPSSSERAFARLTCESCPVRVECLTESLTSGSAFGMWGGFSESEREHLFRQVAQGESALDVALRAIEEDGDAASRDAAERAERRRRAKERKNAAGRERRANNNREVQQCVA